MTDVWIMRVVCSSAGALGRPGVVAGLAAGTYHLVNGDIAEPIECIEVRPGGDMEAAQRHAQERAMTLAARTGCVHKVVLSAGL